MDRSYKVVIAEDEPIIAENIVQKIAVAGMCFHVAGCAQDGAEALAMVDAVAPDVLFTDIRMPKMNGLELIQRVKSRYPEMQVVIISGYGNFEYAQQAIKLGVRDYLLKPINAETLGNTLAEIKARLDSAAAERERRFLLSCATGLSAGANRSDDFEESSLGIYLLCVGNLLNHSPNKARTDEFLRLWSQTQWEDILPTDAGWQVIDEKYPNQKCVILAVRDPSFETNRLAGDLFGYLSSAMAPLPVHVAFSIKLLAYPQTWDAQQELRAILEQRIRIGQSSIHSDAEPDAESPSPAILESAFQDKVSALARQERYPALRSVLLAQLDRWQTTQRTQQWMETVIWQLFKLVQGLSPFIVEDEIVQAYQELNDILCLTIGSHSISEDVCVMILRLLESSKKKNRNIKTMIHKVEEYIQGNYNRDITIDGIARMFNFNSTYLTKVFRKEKGITPVKYITMVRISEAQRLMHDKTELDIKQIGEIVGYDDPQYFSRIFKLHTGKTPSEYRELQL